MNFIELNINEKIANALYKQDITNPTAIQEKSINPIIQNRNIIMQSETGSGKTLAYLLPIYQRQDEKIERGMQVIILVPTKELAIQIQKQVELFSCNAEIELKSAVIFGNVNINRQIEKLREKPQIIIGTTGRILELINKRKITAHTIKTIIIDEADKMLDVNNISDVKAIRKCVMRDTQIIMVSASVSEDTIKVAKELTTNFEIIKTVDNNKIPENIEHNFTLASYKNKIETLRKLIHAIKPEKAIVFINGTSDSEVVACKLQYHHVKAACINGATEKNERKKVVNDFKEGKINILIATDIAARGMHIDDVTTIISFGVCENAIDYLHRAGRCGRNNKKGLCISIITENEVSSITKYEKKFGIKVAEKKLYEGKLIDGRDKKLFLNDKRTKNIKNEK